MRLIICTLAGLLAACDRGPAIEPVAAAQFDRVTAGQVTHGKRLATVLGCLGCHGQDLTGKDWSEPGFGKLWTSNLSRAVADYDDRQLAMVLKTGRRPDRELWEMPSHLFTQLSEEDTAALIAFLRSVPAAGEVHPAPAFEAGAQKEMAAGEFKSSAQIVKEQGRQWPPDAGSEHELGRYIVRSTCAECHRMDLRGGIPFAGAKPRPDLRMVAAYTREQFRTLLKTGKAAGDREVSLMSEVARGRYAHLTDREVDAVHAYLQEVAETSP